MERVWQAAGHVIRDAARVKISDRVLNRALLDRQFLLDRTGRGPLEVIRRLVAVQAH
jgi:hypothetical protein